MMPSKDLALDGSLDGGHAWAAFDGADVERLLEEGGVGLVDLRPLLSEICFRSVGPWSSTSHPSGRSVVSGGRSCGPAHQLT